MGKELIDILSEAKQKVPEELERLYGRGTRGPAPPANFYAPPAAAAPPQYRNY